MVVGLYGLVYLQVAFTDPQRRSSSIVFGGHRFEYDFTRFLIGVGLVGKVLGPIGFVLAVKNGELPVRMFPLIALDDLIWWAPFTMYLINGTRFADGLSRQAPRLCAFVHVAAVGATLLWIRGGSEVEPDPVSRATYVMTHATSWRAAWFIWMFAAVSLGGFYCWWAAASTRTEIARAALVVAGLGLAADFFADSLFIGWLSSPFAGHASFATIESEVVANGLYSIAGAMLMLASAPMRPWFRTLGWAVWLSGFALAAAGALRWNTAIVASSALLFTTFIPWVWLANRVLGKSS